MRVLLPTDFSARDRWAEAHAVELLRSLGGEVTLVHVVTDTPLSGEGVGKVEAEWIDAARRAAAEETLEARVLVLRAAGIAARWRLRAGDPAEEIVEAALSEGADLIVMGTHGRRGVNRLVLGSVAEQVVRRAPCPVVTGRQARVAA
jgi:nucleotide-binding universal stress UspA family protein